MAQTFKATLFELEKQYFIIEQVISNMLVSKSKISSDEIKDYLEALKQLPIIERIALIHEVWEELTTELNIKKNKLQQIKSFNEFPNEDLKTSLIKIM